MRLLSVLMLLTACTPPDLDWDMADRPADYQSPPGEQMLELAGPTTVLEGDLVTWTVYAPDLKVGDRVEMAWASSEGPGRCPYRQRVGGHLCLDITPAWPIAGTNAVEHPFLEGHAIAELSFVVPASPLPGVFLQALKVDGANSSTSNPWYVNTLANSCDDLATPFGGGAGTSADPYLMCADHHLAAMEGLVYTWFTLVRSLDMSDSPVQFVNPGDAVTIDFGGHPIMNYAGTEPLLDLRAAIPQVSNLTMHNVDMLIVSPTGTAYGPVLSQSNSSTEVFSNIDVQGSIEVHNAPGVLVGGVAGQLQSYEADNIRAHVDVYGGIAGGIAGETAGAGTIIDNSVSYGQVQAYGAFAGGLAGRVVNYTLVSNSQAHGDVINVENAAGGLTGEVTFNGGVSHSLATGHVIGGTHAGGFAGIVNHAADVNFCSAWGDVVGGEATGGFVGTGGAINNCYSTGAVDHYTSAASCSGSADGGGGFVGRVDGDLGTIVSAPASVTLDGSTPGYDLGGATCQLDNIADAYVLEADGGAELYMFTDVSMAPESEASYPTLDFVDDWVIPIANPNNPHGLLMPVLQHECDTHGIVCP